MTFRTQPVETPSLIADLDRGLSLPARWYTDPSITDREIARIFRSNWNYIGPLSQLATVGDYITGYAGGVPVVAVRNEQGLAAFVNVCRHRRHEVMKGRGNAKTMQCRYHAWTYDLAGGLRRVPRALSEPDLCLEDFPLLPIRIDTLGPFAFVHLDERAPSLKSLYGSLIDIIASSGVDLDALVPHSREEWRSQANWKTMIENYLECYHCAVAHPGFSAAIDVRPDAYTLVSHGSFLSQTGPVRPQALAGASKTEIYDVAGVVAQSQYHFLWPNVTININPGFPNLSLDVWTPDGPNATRGVTEQFFGPGVSEQFARSLIAFNKQVAREDDELTDSVHRSLRGGLPDRGRFLTSSEQLVGRFQRMVVDAVGADA